MVAAKQGSSQRQFILGASRYPVDELPELKLGPATRERAMKASPSWRLTSAIILIGCAGYGRPETPVACRVS